MILQNAKSVFVREQLNWSRPQLSWFAKRFYNPRRYHG
jgi:hypothetical protein